MVMMIGGVRGLARGQVKSSQGKTPHLTDYLRQASRGPMAHNEIYQDDCSDDKAFCRHLGEKL